MFERLRERCGGDDGFGLVELIVSLSLLTVGFLAVVGATAGSSRILLQGKQRQAAVEEANAHLEHIRNIAYDQVALTTTPAHDPDPKHPDHWVDPDGPNYSATQDTNYEAMVIDAVAGQVVHSETVTVGSTAMTVFRYVTWVDDPDITGTQDYKRVTVVAQYSEGDNAGRANTVDISAFLTDGTVTVGGTTPEQSQGEPEAPPESTPSPTPSGSCDGDTQGPTGSFSILSGSGSETGYTASQTVTVSLAPSDACAPIRVALSNDGTTWGTLTTYDPDAPTMTWTLTGGDGTKNVHAKFLDGIDNETILSPQSIVLDQTRPTVPGTLTRTLSCQGNDRTATLSWGNSTDTNLVGYRVYKEVNGGGFAELLTTSTWPVSDTHLKTLNSVKFKVVGYDRAGNEGDPTNVISLAKNECS